MKIVQGGLKENKNHMQKVHDTMWWDGLWFQLWSRCEGRIWRVVKKMYGGSRSAVFLAGEKSAMFSVEQGVAQDVIMIC